MSLLTTICVNRPGKKRARGVHAPAVPSKGLEQEPGLQTGLLYSALFARINGLTRRP